MNNKDEQERKDLNKKLLKKTFQSEMKQNITDQRKRRVNLYKGLMQVGFAFVAAIVATLVSNRWFEGDSKAVIIIIVILFLLFLPLENLIVKRLEKELVAKK